MQKSFSHHARHYRWEHLLRYTLLPRLTGDIIQLCKSKLFSYLLQQQVNVFESSWWVLFVGVMKFKNDHFKFSSKLKYIIETKPLRIFFSCFLFKFIFIFTFSDASVGFIVIYAWPYLFSHLIIIIIVIITCVTLVVSRISVCLFSLSFLA